MLLNTQCLQNSAGSGELNIRFPLSTLLCGGYSMKLIFVIIIKYNYDIFFLFQLYFVYVYEYIYRVIVDPMAALNVALCLPDRRN